MRGQWRCRNKFPLRAGWWKPRFTPLEQQSSGTAFQWEAEGAREGRAARQSPITPRGDGQHLAGPGGSVTFPIWVLRSRLEGGRAEINQCPPQSSANQAAPRAQVIPCNHCPPLLTSREWKSFTCCRTEKEKVFTSTSGFQRHCYTRCARLWGTKLQFQTPLTMSLLLFLHPSPPGGLRHRGQC